MSWDICPPERLIESQAKFAYEHTRFVQDGGTGNLE